MGIEKENDEKEIEVKETKQKRDEEKEKIKEKIADEKKKEKVNQQIDDGDDSIGIKGLIDVENMSTSELMEIATLMKYRAQKKILKEQRKEVETIQTVIEILSSILLETDIGNLSTPIRKLGQLVADASDQLKSLEEAAQTLVENNYRRKRVEQFMKDIDTGKIALSLNKDLLKNSIETEGRILAYTSNVSFFYTYLKKRQEET